MKDINTDTANIVLLISDFLWLITYLLKQTATARKKKKMLLFTMTGNECIHVAENTSLFLNKVLFVFYIDQFFDEICLTKTEQVTKTYK